MRKKLKQRPDIILMAIVIGLTLGLYSFTACVAKHNNTSDHIVIDTTTVSVVESSN